jgi:hypothetical protein
MRNLLLAALLCSAALPTRASERDTPPDVSYQSQDALGVAAAYSRIRAVRSVFSFGGFLFTQADLDALSTAPDAYSLGPDGLTRSAASGSTLLRFDDAKSGAQFARLVSLAIVNGKRPAVLELQARASAVRGRIAGIEAARAARGILGDGRQGGGCEREEDQYDLGSARATLAVLAAGRPSTPTQLVAASVALDRLLASLE